MNFNYILMKNYQKTINIKIIVTFILINIFYIFFLKDLEILKKE